MEPLSVLKWVWDKVAGKWTGVATVVAGVLVLISAATAWIKEDAVEVCNANWKLEIASKNAEAVKAASKRESRIRDLESKLQAAGAAEEAKAKELENVLELQRDKVPLSEACVACRIPNEHLWVRPGTPNRSSARTISTKGR